ncbi:MAG: hypothetical protein A2427_03565 [Candidatus Nealsonbacteria bacterium RIFOXYC1_FULL_40_7]|uniref:LTD domain-containing protein n=1 Tax=Candidatus Nealsonbacteria bacterium RIFOXYC1_FULL_40_7 TaxID=1801678 RepID=A0A1G2ESE7_9BACT|nr:MAG: hypothetical protein A2427_03565 [Candidatus Nealsonbacteria bacterium RIFOXYC1_FULL_40_7]
MAERIIQNRPFSSVEDLIKVKGIGEKSLLKIKEQGLAFANAENNSQEAPIQNEIIEPHASYPDKIFFVEVMPSPEGKDAEGEYIVIKNGGDSLADLSGWQIRDKEGSSKVFALNKSISALKTLTLFRKETGITLNNSGDGLELLDPNGNIVDSVEFGKSAKGVPYIKTASGWEWKEIKKKEEYQEKASPFPLSQKAEIIDISSGKSKPPAILAGFIVAIVSGGIFLYLKNKL